MRYREAALLVAMIVTVICIGCDADSYNIRGTYDAGTVDFSFGGGDFWRLEDVELYVDTSERKVHFSGYSRAGDLWEWAGSYRRTGNRIVAQDLPEVLYGSSDLIDLHLEFSRDTFSGAVINWVYTERDLQEVGAARISGRRISRFARRGLSPSDEQDRPVPKFDSAQ